MDFKVSDRQPKNQESDVRNIKGKALLARVLLAISVIGSSAARLFAQAHPEDQDEQKQEGKQDVEQEKLQKENGGVITKLEKVVAGLREFSKLRKELEEKLPALRAAFAEVLGEEQWNAFEHEIRAMTSPTSSALQDEKSPWQISIAEIVRLLEKYGVDFNDVKHRQDLLTVVGSTNTTFRFLYKSDDPHRLKPLEREPFAQLPPLKPDYQSYEREFPTSEALQTFVTDSIERLGTASPRLQAAAAKEGLLIHDICDALRETLTKPSILSDRKFTWDELATSFEMLGIPLSDPDTHKEVLQAFRANSLVRKLAKIT